MTQMTAAQMKKLHTIIGKIEALQHEGIKDQRVIDAMRVAKDRLMKVLPVA